MSDAEIDSAPAEALRVAYRALRTLHADELKRMQAKLKAVRERAADVMARLHAAGLYAGGEPPFGFDKGPDGVMLIEVASEQRTIARARAMAEQGRGLRDIARTLTEEGHRSRGEDGAGKIGPQQVKRMLGAPAKT